MKHLRKPNKVEQTNNLVWIYLGAEIKSYLRYMLETIKEEDGVFPAYLKGAVTSMLNIAKEADDEMVKNFNMCYSGIKAYEFDFQIRSRFISKALGRDKYSDDVEAVTEDELKLSIGNKGYEMFKSYISLSAGLLYAKEKLRELSPHLKKFLMFFRKIENFWEKRVMV
ncbi:MAG: hypothetical protein ACRC6E_00520 [Fusobacteriaceae bacterium]